MCMLYASTAPFCIRDCAIRGFEFLGKSRIRSPPDTLECLYFHQFISSLPLSYLYVKFWASVDIAPLLHEGCRYFKNKNK